MLIGIHAIVWTALRHTVLISLYKQLFSFSWNNFYHTFRRWLEVYICLVKSYYLKYVIVNSILDKLYIGSVTYISIVFR